MKKAKGLEKRNKELLRKSPQQDKKMQLGSSQAPRQRAAL